ncbi:hypothetical protein OOZ15_08730 [Galbibacter sp. EGI 63066]|uniref:hypothetical protein n=1 Tax=Galbibacter sp. EGI 63066 TaxID=2993559 RepID=UPI002248BE20|nr:hypothetical protein [Galbibacter sp. EGI 63066]MCX2680019.1 hypothetical protein [Galbibacter sp. EGI 63066]
MRLYILTVALLVSAQAFSQNNINAFFEYDIKDGMKEKFINGYEKDVAWQLSQGDDWLWGAWFVLNGERRGRFIDVTPNHNWDDFDNWIINGAENSRHNNIHWIPYVQNPSGSYQATLLKHSNYKENWFTSKYLQVYKLEIEQGEEETFKHFLQKVKPLMEQRLQGLTFLWMQNISGGNINEHWFLVSVDGLKDLKKCEKLFLFSNEQKTLSQLYGKAVNKNISELWKHVPKLSVYDKIQ